MKSQQPAVTLFVMARNEERCIARCLKSVMHVVDDVVVLDTGSTDQTVEIVKSLDCRVHQIEWPNDFAKARNIGLSFVNTPWVLTLDSDEWVFDASVAAQQFSELASTPMFVYEVGMYMTSYDRQNQNARARVPKFWTPRLFSSRLRYRKPIHEALSHTNVVKRSNIILGHDGYEEAQRRRKTGRNLPLLRARLAENPTDGLLHYYIAQELRSNLFNGGDREIEERFNSALALMADSHPLKEIVFRAALGYAEQLRDYEWGIRIIFQSLTEGVRSVELSYIAGEFLMKCARSEATVDRSLVLSVAKKMFIRVATESDTKSRYFESELDLARLAKHKIHIDLRGV
jgi:glycosyltransferase involved in cell wall biosynthesis